MDDYIVKELNDLADSVKEQIYEISDELENHDMPSYEWKKYEEKFNKLIENVHQLENIVKYL
ncbi:hypothetical protein AB1283_01095 [Bacillus sp. S13(2024)]|uniref:hypothetical protein n=1 Tax=Bacillus sp. S13(2024) TaxID=3162885 RepID=UPI003D233679